MSVRPQGALLSLTDLSGLFCIPDSVIGFPETADSIIPVSKNTMETGSPGSLGAPIDPVEPVPLLAGLPVNHVIDAQ